MKEIRRNMDLLSCNRREMLAVLVQHLQRYFHLFCIHSIRQEFLSGMSIQHRSMGYLGYETCSLKTE